MNKIIQKFEDEGNLVFLTEVETLGDGHTVCHARNLWCEAVDRDHARYITVALNNELTRGDAEWMSHVK